MIMTQELVTYIIVGFAFLAALRLIYKKLAGGKKQKKSCAVKEHDMCSKCPAECMLRDLQSMKKDVEKKDHRHTQPDQRFLRL